MSSSVHLGSLWPKSDKKDRIRWVLAHNIRGIKNDLAQHLKNRLLSRLSDETLLSLSLLLYASRDDQATFEQFSGDQDYEVNDSACEVHGVEFDPSHSQDTEICVVIYIRVSSDEQKRNGRSIKSQLEALKSIVENNPEISLYCEPIVDDGETGTNFDRDGIMKAARMAQNEEVTHLMVDTIDRIGREIARTLMYMQELREKMDVKIMNGRREIDMKKPEHKMIASSKAMTANFATQNRARSAKRASADGFLKDKQYGSWYQKAPFGYKFENEEGNDPEARGWIEPIEKFGPVIEEIYKEFIQRENYADVAQYVNEKYGDMINDYYCERSQHRNDEEYERSDEPINGSQIKSIISDPVYEGEPIIPVTNFEQYGDNPSVDDEELAFINQQTNRKAQKIAKNIYDKYSNNSEVSLEPEEYSEIFDPHIIETVCSGIKLVCPKCSSEMNCDGHITKLGNGLGARMYSCSNSNCNHNKRWPTESEVEMMEMLSNFDEFHSLL